MYLNQPHCECLPKARFFQAHTYLGNLGAWLNRQKLQHAVLSCPCSHAWASQISFRYRFLWSDRLLDSADTSNNSSGHLAFFWLPEYHQPARFGSNLSMYLICFSFASWPKGFIYEEERTKATQGKPTRCILNATKRWISHKAGCLSLMRREYVIHFTQRDWEHQTIIRIQGDNSEWGVDFLEIIGNHVWYILISSFIDQSTMSIKFREEPCGESWDSAPVWAARRKVLYLRGLPASWVTIPGHSSNIFPFSVLFPQSFLDLGSLGSFFLKHFPGWSSKQEVFRSCGRHTSLEPRGT